MLLTREEMEAELKRNAAGGNASSATLGSGGGSGTASAADNSAVNREAYGSDLNLNTRGTISSAAAAGTEGVHNNLDVYGGASSGFVTTSSGEEGLGGLNSIIRSEKNAITGVNVEDEHVTINRHGRGQKVTEDGLRVERIGVDRGNYHKRVLGKRERMGWQSYEIVMMGCEISLLDFSEKENPRTSFLTLYNFATSVV